MTTEDLKKKLAAAEKARDAIAAPNAEEADLLAKIAAAEAETERRKIAAREAAEDARFAGYQVSAVAPVRLGEVRLEPGQAIFRQIDLSTKRLIESKAEEERGTMIEAEFRACIVYPPGAELAKWELEYPGVVADIMLAWGDHNRATRRSRLGK